VKRKIQKIQSVEVINNLNKNTMPKKNILDFCIVIVSSFSLLFLLLAFRSPLQATDDTKILPINLDKINQKNILGASNQNQDYLYGCTEEKPVIGWINYSGQKIITQDLPSNETASSCFKSITEAKQAGFEIKKDK
jgi:hypothetical protein